MLKELKEEDFIVSKTDLKGKIIYCNKNFIEISEYKEEELLNQPHNILRHHQTPKAIFKYLWKNIQKKEEVFAFIINKTKNNNEYWVYANVTATLDTKNNIVDYYSVRRKANPKALDIIIPLYKKMIEVERYQGIDASLKVLEDLLQEKGNISYDEFIISLQKL